MVLASGIQNFYLAVVCLLSRSRLGGTQGGRLYTTIQIWVLAGLHGACSGRSKPRILASNHGVAFRGARAGHYNGKLTQGVYPYYIICQNGLAFQSV